MKKIRKSILAIWLSVFAYILCGCTQKNEVLLLPADETMESSDAATGSNAGAESDAGVGSDAAAIVVYLCGAVNSPGVIALPEGSRINDAIVAAGGFREDAVVTSVNLAAKLSDEEMIYVASNSDEVLPELNEVSSKDKLVNINTADISKLCELPGIGESKARDIILYRENNGAFQKKEDVMRVDGIKQSLYNKIEEMISVK